jgi:MoaA/NifB/PqqE/SkfB family radical SAM enzyme
MCDIWKTTEDEQLSVEQLESHLSDIEHLRVKWVVFSGGEPLMHTDLFRLSAMLR